MRASLVRVLLAALSGTGLLLLGVQIGTVYGPREGCAPPSGPAPLVVEPVLFDSPAIRVVSAGPNHRSVPPTCWGCHGDLRAR